MNRDIDILQFISLYIGLLNLYENREQTAHNDVSKANDKQAEYMLKELKSLFEEQNRKIDAIIERLDINENYKRTD